MGQCCFRRAAPPRPPTHHTHPHTTQTHISDIEKDGSDGAGPPPSTDDPENTAPAAFSGGADAAAAVVCHHAAILRSKRLLLTYLSERLERVKALRWRHAALPSRRARRAVAVGGRVFRRLRPLAGRDDGPIRLVLRHHARGAPPRGRGRRHGAVCRSRWRRRVFDRHLPPGREHRAHAAPRRGGAVVEGGHPGGGHRRSAVPAGDLMSAGGGGERGTKPAVFFLLLFHLRCVQHSLFSFSSCFTQ